MPSNPTGKRLGQYEIKGLIAQGGMASIYRAYQTSMDRDVAIKVILEQQANNPDFIARFEREARLVAKLQHPHILPVYDFGREEGENLIYLVMRLVEGGSLDTQLPYGGLALVQAGRIFTAVASALTYAHEQGVIHRDLKPNNILLDEHNNPYLTDFGIARMTHEQNRLTATGAMIGTPAYMAPEQWRGEEIDARTDIYALGIMLYEMLTDDLPFSGQTPFEIMYKHFDAPPPSIRILKPEFSAGIDKVIDRALAKRKTDRYASAIEMANDLNAILASGSVDAQAEKWSSIPRVNSGEDKMAIGGIDTALPDDKTKPQIDNLAGTTRSGQAANSLGEFLRAALQHTRIAATRSGQAPTRKGYLPLIVVVAGIIVIMAGGVVFTLQGQANAKVTAVQIAALSNMTQTGQAIINATATERAIPTGTSTPILSATRVSFQDYIDQELNIRFRYPKDWEVRKPNDVSGLAGQILYVTNHFDDLTFNQDGSITGPPYVVIILGQSQTFGALGMASAPTTADALAMILGPEKTQNLEPVYGAQFSAASEWSIDKHGNKVTTYLLTLGPDRFVILSLHIAPELSDSYSNSTVLPLVRSFGFVAKPTVAPTIAPASATPNETFVAPINSSSFTSNNLNISFRYPQGWAISDIATGIQGTVLIGRDGGVTGDPTTLRLTEKATIPVSPTSNPIDLFTINWGNVAKNPIEVSDAPFPSVYGRVTKSSISVVNGWALQVTLNSGMMLNILAEAPSGFEQQYLESVLLPLVKSLVYHTETANQSAGDYIFTSNALHISFHYPKGWSIYEHANLTPLSISMSSPDNAATLLIFEHPVKDVFYTPGDSILDTFHQNEGDVATDSTQIIGAPFATAYGRTLRTSAMKVNGWVAFAVLDDNTSLTSYLDVPNGKEDQYLNNVFLPLFKSLVYKNGP